jgi:hypothetical protein
VFFRSRSAMPSPPELAALVFLNQATSWTGDRGPVTSISFPKQRSRLAQTLRSGRTLVKRSVIACGRLYSRYWYSYQRVCVYLSLYIHVRLKMCQSNGRRRPEIRLAVVPLPRRICAYCASSASKRRRSGDTL